MEEEAGDCIPVLVVSVHHLKDLLDLRVRLASVSKEGRRCREREGRWKPLLEMKDWSLAVDGEIEIC